MQAALSCFYTVASVCCWTAGSYKTIHHAHIDNNSWSHRETILDMDYIIHQHEATFTANARHVITLMYDRHYACLSALVRMPCAVPAW